MHSVSKPVLQDPIISQREPFQLYLLLFGIIIGFLVLRDDTVSVVLREQQRLAPGLVKVWGTFVFSGSLIATIGCFWPRRKVRGMLLGLHLERLGLTLLGGAVGTFAIMAWASAGQEAALVVGQNLAFTAACITRVIYIARRFGWYRREADR